MKTAQIKFYHLKKICNPFAIIAVPLIMIGLFISLSTVTCYGQSSKKIQKWFNEAKTLFYSKNWNECIQTGSKILKADPNHRDIHLLLSEVYLEMDSVSAQIHHLQMAKRLGARPLIDFRLGEVYYSIGDYENAEGAFKNYLASGKANDQRVKDLQHKLKNCEFGKKALKNPVSFHPVRLSEQINSRLDEYWPNLTVDEETMVFTRLVEAPGKRPQEDFYSSNWENGHWTQAKAIQDLNTFDNEGAQCLSADGKELFFTACNRADGFGSCDLYYSYFKNGSWSVPVNLGEDLNTGYWEGHPSVSSDRRYLFFSSNRPKGKGGKDIWRAELIGNHESGLPRIGKVEMLESLNTSHDEISPFIHPNSRTLYFASKGHPGMGGFDLYYSEMNFKEQFHEVYNMGYPINTFKDEQGMVINGSGQLAYFGSSRIEDMGIDIYSFEIDPNLRPDPVTFVKARIYDHITNESIRANVDLLTFSEGDWISRLEKSDERGEILLCLPLGYKYAFHVSVSGYLFDSRMFDLEEIHSERDPFIVDIGLKPIQAGAEMQLYNIYFESDSFRILQTSEPELNKLYELLVNNPGLQVEIQGHTDSSGDPSNNMLLSQNRAKSVLEYLLARGLAENRLTYKGFGQSKPVADNETPEGKQLNRRTTIRITGI